MNGIDLARFEFDYDTTWQAFFLDAELNVYSRYGGRDEHSADGRHSKDSLLQTMREVLEAHERRGAGGGPSREFQPAPGHRAAPEDIPLLRDNHQGCVHCHQVAEYRLLQSFHDGTFDKSQLFGFPLTESVGISFDRSHGHRIEAVLGRSAAARAGLAAGDVVRRVGDVPVRSEQDVRWALHRSAEGRPVAVTVERAPGGGSPPEPVSVELLPQAGWRQSELSWRKSLRSVPFPAGFLGYALGGEELRKAGLSEEGLAIRVVSIRGDGFATNVGLHKGDTIVALEGRTSRRTLEQFTSDLLRRYEPGDLMRLAVLREGRRVELQGAFPAWHTSDTAVP